MNKPQSRLDRADNLFMILVAAIAVLAIVLVAFLGLWLYRKCHSDTIYDERTPAALERIADVLEAQNQERFGSENALRDLRPNKTWSKGLATVPCEILVGGCP